MVGDVNNLKRLFGSLSFPGNFKTNINQKIHISLSSFIEFQKMSTYTIKYFPSPGRAFVTRVMLNLAGATWKNEFPEWPQEKPNMPYERMPVLVEKRADGSEFVLTESNVIERYIAQKYGFLPGDLVEAATLEQYVSHMLDSRDAIRQIVFSTDNEENRRKATETTKFFIKKHEPVLAKSSSGFHHGDKVSYPDIFLLYIYNFSEMSSIAGTFNETDCPNIMKLIKILKENPLISSVSNDK
ncbi:hypothetical protein BB558_002999 [Smittium angustum]|uniref:GST N-terminal domain-containing protein n=1 Tax=Smittium angustum TaxID=133377 RepID=A0A2U1J773_SMIAN|nr:hypothetical protein BB558_002999 [Smittium angustum]